LRTPALLPTEELAAGLLDSEGCLDLQEDTGAKPGTPCTSKPQRTQRLPERLRDYVVNLLQGT